MCLIEKILLGTLFSDMSYSAVDHEISVNEPNINLCIYTDKYFTCSYDYI